MDPEPYQQIVLSSINYFGSFSTSSAIHLAILLVLLLCSALISGAEVAFFSLTPSDHHTLNSSEDKSHHRILNLLSTPKQLLATILISNNFVNIGIVILSTYIVNDLINQSLDEVVIFIIQVVVVTFLILLFGEVIPKVYASKQALKFASFMSSPLSVARIACSPFSKPLVAFSKLIDKRIKAKNYDLSVEHLEHALDLTRDEETSEEEHKILRGIVEFGNTEVQQIMKARIDVKAIDQSMNFREVHDFILDAGFSRIPVYEESFDNIKGILYIKDLLPHLNEPDDFKWLNLIRSPFFVPEGKKIDDLLKEFQDKKIHMAIVVDEYGGTCGLVTLEDILEEIVGEISDEFDDEDIIYSKLDDNNYVFEGKTPLKDFYRSIGTDGEDIEKLKGEAESLAGFILEHSGQLPNKNDIFEIASYRFKIEHVDNRRITRIKVTILEDKQTDSSS